jgi:hypothetical protein
MRSRYSLAAADFQEDVRKGDFRRKTAGGGSSFHRGAEKTKY